MPRPLWLVGLLALTVSLQVGPGTVPQAHAATASRPAQRTALVRAGRPAGRAALERPAARLRARGTELWRSLRTRLNRLTTAVRTWRMAGAAPHSIVGPRANPLDYLPPAQGERIVFAVLGRSILQSKRISRRAFRVGEEIVASQAETGGQHITMTGAPPGLPDESVKGARSKGGLTVGISPRPSLKKHIASGAPTDFTVLQTTKLPPAQRGQNRPNFTGREIDLGERADVGIILGGGPGTTQELSIFVEEKRPIGVLLDSGSWTDLKRDKNGKEIEGSTTIHALEADWKRTRKGPILPIIYERDPSVLVRKLIAAKHELDRQGIVRGPLGEK